MLCWSCYANVLSIFSQILNLVHLMLLQLWNLDYRKRSRETMTHFHQVLTLPQFIPWSETLFSLSCSANCPPRCSSERCLSKRNLMWYPSQHHLLILEGLAASFGFVINHIQPQVTFSAFTMTKKPKSTDMFLMDFSPWLYSFSFSLPKYGNNVVF